MQRPANITISKRKASSGWRLMLNIGVKALLLLGIGLVFYFQIFKRQDIDEISKAFMQALDSASLAWLIAALAFVPINWLAETYKWKMLLNNFGRFSSRKLYMAVLAGITVSLFTPNRVGEYAGRVLFLPAKMRWRATMATLTGSLAQLIPLIGFGLLALGGFSYRMLGLNNWLILSAALLSALILSFLLLSYFNLDLVDRLLARLPKWKWLLKARKPVSYLGEFSSDSLARSLGFASLRYAVYGLQYYLVARFFGIQIGPQDAFLVIGSIYLLQTSIPLPPIWSLLVRGQVALYFWGFFCTNPILILAATFGIWVINLILPALIGMVFLMLLNIPATLGYETKKD